MSSKPKNFTQALHDLEDISTSAAADLKEKLERELRSLEEKISDLKPQLDAIKDRVSEEARHTKKRVENQVKSNPWTAMGIVGLVGLVLGFIIAAAGMRDRD
jgi:ElaB/YqjD/DUF883 family membrane-anchored ribosome-binding protein